MKHIRYGLGSAGQSRRYAMHRRAMVGAALIVCVLNPSGRLLAAEEQVRRDSTISPGRDEFLGRFLDYYVGWAGKIEERGQSTGTPLDPEQTRLALEIGIKHPERVRLVFVDEVPFPTDNPEIKLAGEKFGFIGPGITNNAQAFGYSVWIRNGFSLDRPRLAHELVHVMQIERSTGFAAYARQYVSELLQYGHEKSPLELEAYEANRRYAD